LRIISERIINHENTKGRKHEEVFGQDLQDVQDGMQGSLETPLRGDPKAAPWDEWETLVHKNKLAHFCASRVPIISGDPIKPVS
jgi:hypothetical protein